MIDQETWERELEVPRTNKMLVVDDEVRDAKIEADIVASLGYEVFMAHDAATAYSLIEKENPDILVLDFMLPETSGLEILRNVRRRFPATYVIMVTGQGSEKVAIELMRSGASDYLVKPISSIDRFEQSIERVLRLREAEIRTQLTIDRLQELNVELEKRVQERTDDLRRTNLLLKQLVVRDHLTGLYNQRALYSELDEEIVRASRYGQSLGFLMLDLDHFKVVNDTYGHQTGSALLMQIAEILKSSLRQVDKPARFGGDEFSVVLPSTGKKGVREAAERIRLLVERETYVIDGARIKLTVSLGGSIYEPGCSTKEIIRRADAALYRAKAAGRNCVRLSFE